MLPSNGTIDPEPKTPTPTDQRGRQRAKGVDFECGEALMRAYPKSDISSYDCFAFSTLWTDRRGHASNVSSI